MSSRRHVVLAVVLLFLACVLLQTSPKSNAQTPIKIGVVLSLSGAAAVWGGHAKNGLELALAEVNKSGVNGRRIELVFRDCKTNGNEAVNVFQDLIDKEQVSVVIGDVTSTCTVPMSRVANERGVVLITPGASYPDLSKENDYVFRFWYSDEQEGTQDARFAKENAGWSRVTTLFIDAYYGQGINRVFVKKFDESGTVVDEIPFKQDQKDFEVEVNRILARKPLPDGIFLVGYINETAALLKALRSNKETKEIKILCPQPFNILEVVEKADGAAEGVVFSVPRAPASSDKAAEDFRKKYSDKYGQDIQKRPADFSASSYDALKLVADVLAKGAQSGSAIKDALQNHETFQSAAFGPVSFDEYGDVPQRQFDFKRVQNSSFVLLGGDNGIAPVIEREPGFLEKYPEYIIAIVGILFAGLGIVFARFAHTHFLKFWQSFQWRMSLIWFRKVRNSTQQMHIVTLGDYVTILERQRQAIVSRCEKRRAGERPTIVIYSYTMQLPRDWPLWEVERDELLQGHTPLEQYFRGFKDFVLAKGTKYDVKLKRVIVIDSSDSPRGLARQAELETDVISPYFEKYLDLLHTSKEDAYYYLHKRPWPGWLTDSVFYALEEPPKPLRWLWAVTTSYNVGEDLIILRLHKLGKSEMSSVRNLSMPFAVKSLDELARMADFMGARPLSSLRDGISRENANAAHSHQATAKPTDAISEAEGGGNKKTVTEGDSVKGPTSEIPSVDASNPIENTASALGDRNNE